MNKLILPIAFSLIVGSFAWGGMVYQESAKKEEQIQQYESYLSSHLTTDMAKLLSNIHGLSSYIDNVIKEKKVESSQNSMVIGQMFETMDIIQQTEELAVKTDQFNQPTPSYATANILYLSSMYLSNLESSASLKDNDIEKIQTIQSFLHEYAKIVSEQMPELETEEGFDQYFEKYEKTMIREKLWLNVINQMDKKTASLLKDKKIENIGDYLMTE